jgi:hypothetical protein
MWYTKFLMISAGALWLLLWPGAWGQRIQRVNELESDPVLIDGKMKSNESNILPDGQEIVPANTEQVSISTNLSDSPSEQPVPITALLFNGSPGPKDCRGNVVLNISLTKPVVSHSRPTCYNVPGVAQCGNFLANEADGCQARVFSEPDCLTFANVAVFVPEVRAFGGYMRSVEITCGVVSEAPPPLKLPGFRVPPDALRAVG